MQKAESRIRAMITCRFVVFCLLLSAYCFVAAGCRRDMQDQPKAIAYRESTFFKDGVSSRPPVEGTVPRGYPRADREVYFCKKSGYRTRSSSDPLMESSWPAHRA